MRTNLKAYKKVNVESSLATADPHQVIVMMYNGFLESLATAKGAIERKDLATKSTAMTKAISILQALQSSLDANSEPQISKIFNDLYSTCIDMLHDANLSLDISILEEVSSYISPLRDAWLEIPETDKQQGLKLLKEKNSQQETAVGL